MRTWVPLVAAIALISSATLSFSEDGAEAPAGMLEKPAALQQGGDGTAPDGKGSTGWTGGSRTANDSPAAGKNPEAPQNQPFVATGQDLNGPPRQFPAQETPE